MTWLYFDTYRAQNIMFNELPIAECITLSHTPIRLKIGKIDRRGHSVDPILEQRVTLAAKCLLLLLVLSKLLILEKFRREEIHISRSTGRAEGV